MPQSFNVSTKAKAWGPKPVEELNSPTTLVQVIALAQHLEEKPHVPLATDIETKCLYCPVDAE